MAAGPGRGSFEPIGAAQGWDPASYADSVRQLQDIGYTASPSVAWCRLKPQISSPAS